MSETHTGACFCGAVEFEVTGAPLTMGYCHCKDCTAWLGAPVNAFSFWSPDGVQLTKGAENVGVYNKSEHSFRKFCRTCGGALMTEHPTYGFVDVYPSVIPGFVHVPELHVHYAHKTISVPDGLPKFKDLPSQYGGSGETLPE